MNRRIPAPTGDLDIVEPLAVLARTASADFTGRDMLRELARVAGRVIVGAGTGVLQVEARRVGFVHAGPELVEVERLQEQLQRGPGIDSVTARAAVVVPDIAAARQWPEYARAAQRAGARTMVAMPLLARGCDWGVLDLYRPTTTSWTAAELTAVRRLSDGAASHIAAAADRDPATDTRRDLEHRATHDELTGLPNRALLFDRMEHAVDGAERLGTAVSVLLVDVDQFKRVNDTLGQLAGDAVLVEVAGRLKGVLREMDTLARLSGDEFVVVCEDLAGTPDEIDAWMGALTRRLQAAVRRPIRVAGRELVVSVSVGATVAGDSREAHDLVDRADRARYAGKESSLGRLARRGRVSG